MQFKRTCFFLIVIFLPFLAAMPQGSLFRYNVNTTGGFTSSGTIPFWLRSNQYGSIPLSKISLNLIGSAGKEYDYTSKKLVDWGGSFETRVNAGKKLSISLIEGYAKLRVSIFEIKAGRSKETMGLCDTILSSGSFSVSGNALGIPKVQISIPEFYSLPFFGKLFAFKGNFAHGWIGEASVRLLNNDTVQLKTYLHQKSLYGRFGKPGWKWKLYGGFNHQAFWGSEKTYYGSLYTLSPFEAYLYIITGKPYGTSSIPTSKIGNHLGSIDLGFEYDFKNFRILAYRQNIYDIGALFHLANLRDGLNGLSLVNTRNTKRVIDWRRMLIEFFYTKNQAGELWSPFTPSGDENYYNNDQYLDGWSYRGAGIGNPFICTRTYTREGLTADPGDHFINNRVMAFHFGFEGSVRKLNIILKTSYSMNYGTFGTSEVGHTLGKVRTLPRYGIFKEKNQFSSFLEVNKTLKSGFILSGITAFDIGGLYYNSFGLLFGVSKSF